MAVSRLSVQTEWDGGEASAVVCVSAECAAEALEGSAVVASIPSLFSLLRKNDTSKLGFSCIVSLYKYWVYTHTDTHTYTNTNPQTKPDVWSAD